MFGNRINYAKQGWRLTSDDAQIEYRSHINGFECNDPNGWLSAPAHNDRTGQDGKIWWYWPVDRRELEDGGEWVKDWNKCNDIEIIEEDTKMTYQIALEKNESAEGLDLSELSLEDLLELIDDVPGWDYPLGEESVRELAWRAGIDVGRYFAEPEYCDRAGCWRENPDYSEDEPHGFDYNDLFADAAKALDVDF